MEKRAQGLWRIRAQGLCGRVLGLWRIRALGLYKESRARLKKGSADTQQYEMNTNGAWTINGKLKAMGGDITNR